MANLHTRICAHYRNMNAWKGAPAPDVVSDLNAFFEENPFPEEVRRIFLIKQCVYIALGCFKSYSLDNLVVDLAVNYCREYLRRTEQDDDSGRNKTRAVFNAAAGDFLRYRAKKTAEVKIKIERLREAYDFFDRSVNIAKALDDMSYLGYQLGNRGDVAFHLSDFDSDARKWLLLAAQDKAESAEILESIHPKHAAHQHIYAANNKFLLSKSAVGAEKKKFLLEAVRHGSKALEVLPADYDLRCSVGSYYETLFALTGEKSHYVDACNSFRGALRAPDEARKVFARRKLKELKKSYKEYLG